MTTPRRRGEDPRIQTLADDVAALRWEIKRNTEITEKVADILASFRVISAVAKWVSAIGAAALAVYHGWDVLRIK